MGTNTKYRSTYLEPLTRKGTGAIPKVQISLDYNYSIGFLTTEGDLGDKKSNNGILTA